MKLVRPLHLLTGVAGYLLALGSMVYFAGFLGGLLVPKGVDSGPIGPAAVAWPVDLVLLVSFGVVHSLLAREGVKRALAWLVPAPLERSLYSAVAGLQIVALCALWRPLPEPVWSVGVPAARLALWALFALGWLIVLAALQVVGTAQLFGLAQASASARGVEHRPLPLEAGGIYRHVRHPLYSGTLVALWAAPLLSRGHLLLAGVFTIYLAIGYRFEERDLARRHGAPYLAYRAAVPAFFPRLGAARRLR